MMIGEDFGGKVVSFRRKRIEVVSTPPLPPAAGK